MDVPATSSEPSTRVADKDTSTVGDEIIDLVQQFLSQSPSDFSITILPTTETTTTPQGTSPSNDKKATPSLDYSIVLVDGHLGIDARSLPWITRELRKAYNRLRHDEMTRRDYNGRYYDNDATCNTNSGNEATAEKMIQTTECLLLVNPDHSTVWADRRRALLQKSITARRDIDNNSGLPVWKAELSYLDLLFTQHSKA